MTREPAWRRYSRLFGPDTVRDVDDEFEFHIATRADELIRSGIAPHEANARARVEFGDAARARQLCEQIAHRENRRPWASFGESVLSDVRYAMRSFRRSPAFAAVAILTLALGIGVNSALFSAVDTLVLRPLAFHDANSLQLILQLDTQRGDSAPVITYGDYGDLRARSDLFQDVGLVTWWGATMVDDHGPVVLVGRQATSSLFKVLDVKPELGRAFLPEDEEPGKENVLLISHATWASRFGGEPSVVGRVVRLDDKPYTIVGVLPRSFDLPYPQRGAEIWSPIPATPRRLTNRTYWNYFAITRLRPGVSRQHAAAGLAAVGAQLRAAHPEAEGTRAFALQSLRDRLAGDRVRPLLAMFGAAGLVLLIACVNLVNLLLTRNAGRARELSVRVALGAGRARLARQLGAESVVLAVLGGALGVLIALMALALIARIGWSDTARLAEVGLNGRLLGFCAVLSLVAGMGSAIVPITRVSRGALHDALREGGRASSTAGRKRVRDLLAVSEIALAFVLLAGAALMFTSLAAALRADAGFDRSRLLTFRASIPSARYDSKERAGAFFDQLESEVARIPSVRSVAMTSALPLSGELAAAWVSRQDAPVAPGQTPPEANYQMVRPGYYQAMRIPLLRGRSFTLHDVQAAHVSIISESLARRLFPGEDPIGKRIETGEPTGKDWHEIIGVVGDVRMGALVDKPVATVYELYGQHWDNSLAIAVRTTGDPLSVLGTVRARLKDLDPTVPLDGVATMDALAQRSVVDRRFVLVLLGTFAALAVVLATIGVYGVMAHGVAQRTREFGVRMALGATSRGIMGGVLSRGGMIAMLGIAAGAAASLAFSRALSSLLYGVRPTDPLTLTVVALTLGATTLLASWLPARRATRVDPAIALRGD